MIPVLTRGLALAAAVLALGLPAAGLAQTAVQPASLPPEEGPHAFDFLIGDWKVWLDYDGASSARKIFGSDANIEDFKVDDAKE